MNPHFFTVPFLLTYSYFIYCTLSHFTAFCRTLRQFTVIYDILLQNYFKFLGLSNKKRGALSQGSSFWLLCYLLSSQSIKFSTFIPS